MRPTPQVDALRDLADRRVGAFEVAQDLLSPFGLAGFVRAEQLHRELQWQIPGRVPKRALV